MDTITIKDIITSFLQSEINTQELYDDIINFVTSFHVRNGEFEGNEYIIKKMDQTNFIIYSEYETEQIKREIHAAFSIYRHDLIRIINSRAESIGIITRYGAEA